MSTNRTLSSSNGPQAEKTDFELQREELLVEVARSLENVLANLNKLNRNLEQVIAVGHEFSSVEALWSRFEDVMAKDPDVERDDLPDEGDVTGVNIGTKS